MAKVLVGRKPARVRETDCRDSSHHYQQLIRQTRRLKPIRTAVVHPVDANSLLGAIEAAKANLIVPVLVGPEARIRAAADQTSIDLSPYELLPAEHSHAAAARAVGLARDHKVEALMKGSLHTDEFMSAVVGEEKLRTARRMSHVFMIEAPRYPRTLFVTDAALNIYPTLEEKADIVQNAICLAHTLGLERPKVAILSAVETVSPKIKSTLDAAVLCKMADRGQITGGILDGPLAFHNAVSEEAANAKNIVSPVAGRADILLVPDLDSGNMLAKQFEYLAGAQLAGIVLGARVPIVLTSRADKAPARLVSCAIARLLARNNAGSELLGADCITDGVPETATSTGRLRARSCWLWWSRRLGSLATTPTMSIVLPMTQISGSFTSDRHGFHPKAAITTCSSRQIVRFANE